MIDPKTYSMRLWTFARAEPGKRALDCRSESNPTLVALFGSSDTEPSVNNAIKEYCKSHFWHRTEQIKRALKFFGRRLDF